MYTLKVDSYRTSHTTLASARHLADDLMNAPADSGFYAEIYDDSENRLCGYKWRGGDWKQPSAWRSELDKAASGKCVLRHDERLMDAILDAQTRSELLELDANVDVALTEEKINKEDSVRLKELIAKLRKLMA